MFEIVPENEKEVPTEKTDESTDMAQPPSEIGLTWLHLYVSLRIVFFINLMSAPIKLDNFIN